MKKMMFIILLFIVLTFCSCDSPPEFAEVVTPSGEIPDLIETLPDRSFIALLYADLAEPDDGQLALELIENAENSAQAELLSLIVKKPFAIAVNWNAIAWPNIQQSIQPILISAQSLQPEDLRKMFQGQEYIEVPGDEYTLFTVSVDTSMSASLGMIHVAVAENHFSFISNSEELIRAAIEQKDVEFGQSESIGLNSLVQQADKSKPVWFVMKQTPSSRDLLKSYLPGFNECIGYLDFSQNINILAALSFDEARQAKDMTKFFDLTKKQINKYRNILVGNAGPQAEILVDLMEQFVAKTVGNMVVFEAEIERGQLSPMKPETTETTEDLQ